MWTRVQCGRNSYCRAKWVQNLFFTSQRGVDYYFLVVFFIPFRRWGLSTRQYAFLVFTVVGGGGSGEGMCFLKVRVIGGGLLA